ncbi:hypothetical protein [Actinokineospora spheciospongiae]|uniref:hypothetical protein n=1 Tax=Actinokineospora spheciospongiae TaxID=909613 RepID=UPI0005530452|nr:hypothetical protein [Actinokineospora spheciospongiae]PWW67134.1 hypothetical protein DFQ13_101652 [Actinokineospora spheciospongiae]
MRLLVLYLRSRQVPTGLPGAVLAVTTIGLLGNGSTNPQAAVASAVLALAIGLAVLGYGLGGADPALERTASLRWPPRRAAHVLATAAAVATTALAATSAPTGFVLRAAVGLAGLTALAATLLGRQLAWTLPVAGATVAAAMPPVADPLALRLLTWPVQPLDSTTATITAGALGVAGLALYTARGCRT